MIILILSSLIISTLAAVFIISYENRAWKTFNKSIAYPKTEQSTPILSDEAKTK